MKKLFFLSLLVVFAFCTTANARTQYDRNNKIIYDDTIRGQKRAVAQEVEQKRKIQAAAAARLDYEQALKSLEDEQKRAFPEPIKK